MAFVEDTWARFIPTRPFVHFFISDYLDSKYRREHRQGRLFARSAIVAVLLACLGTAGLAAFAAEQRAREMGIRKVLGASPRHLLVLLGRDFAKLVVVASLIACPIGYFLMRDWLQNFAYRLDLDVFPFAASGLGTLLVTALTVGYQCFKAARANPADVLRRE